MNWLRPRAWSFVVGSLITMILGFTWGGWTTGSTADRLATEWSEAAVTAALVPVCLEKSKADPASAKKLVALRALPSTFDQRDAVLKDGWATIGSGEGNRDVADLCAAQLAKTAVVK
jgi:hypothetical protein